MLRNAPTKEQPTKDINHHIQDMQQNGYGAFLRVVNDEWVRDWDQDRVCACASLPTKTSLPTT